MFQELMQHLFAVQMRTIHECCGTHGLRVTRSEQDTTCHNPLDILSYSAWNSEIPITGDSFRGAVCPTFITLLAQHSPELPKHKGRASWVSFDTNMWCLETISSYPNTYGVCTTQFNSKRKSGEVTCIRHVESQNCPEFRSQPCVPISHDLAKCLKLGRSITPPPCSITQLISWTISGRSPYHHLPVLTAQKLSESPHLWILLAVSLNRNFDWIIGQWGLFQSQCPPLPRKLQEEHKPLSTPRIPLTNG